MYAAIEKGLRDHLLGDGTLSAYAAYNGLAPLEATLPYLIFFHSAGGSENNTQLESGDVRYVVKAVSDSPTTAVTMADAIRSRLHNQTFALDAPWYVVKCNELAAVRLIETVERKIIYHLGATYRIRVSK